MVCVKRKGGESLGQCKHHAIHISRKGESDITPACNCASNPNNQIFLNCRIQSLD